ncbi:MAG: ribonuclease H-like domain-containing protein [Anaerolineae bacterium]
MSDSAATLYEMRNQLRNLGPVRVPPPSPAVQVRAFDLQGLCSLLGAEEHGSPGDGRFLLVRHTFADGQHHGHRPLACPPSYNPATLSLLAKDARLESLSAEQAVFLDIETTGLAGGTGTFAFLVGLGRFVGDQLEVLQYFLPGPADERAFLAAVLDSLRERSLLVTYNGRCFDAPLLQSRFTLQRQRVPLNAWPHLDLLYPARNVYRGRLPDCCLSTVEANALGVVRTRDDIPGALIPGIYFDYLREGLTALMPGVFYHNLMDIVSLAALTTTLTEVAEGAPTCHPLDHLGAARMLETAGRWAEAREAYHRAARGTAGAHRRLALLRLAALLKRSGEFEEAAGVWQGLVDGRADPTGEAYVELAKHLEHRKRDPAAAAQTTRLAQHLPVAQQQPLKADLAHRLDRLERRLARTERAVEGSANAVAEPTLSASVAP